MRNKNNRIHQEIDDKNYWDCKDYSQRNKKIYRNCILITLILDNYYVKKRKNIKISKFQFMHTKSLSIRKRRIKLLRSKEPATSSNIFTIYLHLSPKYCRFLTRFRLKKDVITSWRNQALVETAKGSFRRGKKAVSNIN